MGPKNKLLKKYVDGYISIITNDRSSIEVNDLSSGIVNCKNIIKNDRTNPISQIVIMRGRNCDKECKEITFENNINNPVAFLDPSSKIPNVFLVGPGQSVIFNSCSGNIANIIVTRSLGGGVGSNPIIGLGSGSLEFQQNGITTNLTENEKYIYQFSEPFINFSAGSLFSSLERINGSMYGKEINGSPAGRPREFSISLFNVQGGNIEWPEFNEIFGNADPIPNNYTATRIFSLTSTDGKPVKVDISFTFKIKRGMIYQLIDGVLRFTLTSA
ncbi:MAG: hypothetical protein Hyperionvirus13_47 [Hyperionvirus sp.]|uniref:Uncharacterized protein n=1 Tax=Hyperionvirus sp. TaxID=2487770 RepID=A0A3G5ABC3_9VIRU|nr:MAG: hypothetical protein Hyperionvirus13_47 [Hyperionvirus sp.]